MNFHPLAEGPMMGDEPFLELRKSIRKHGLQKPIVIYEGMILDGRNRFRACEAEKIDPKFVTYKGDDAASFVLMENIYRRHLTPSQKALWAVKLLGSKKGKTLAKAAKTVGVSKRSVSRAKRVLSQADDRTKYLMSRGQMSVKAAESKIKKPKRAPGPPLSNGRATTSGNHARNFPRREKALAALGVVIRAAEEAGCYGEFGGMFNDLMARLRAWKA